MNSKCAADADGFWWRRKVVKLLLQLEGRRCRWSEDHDGGGGNRIQTTIYTNTPLAWIGLQTGLLWIIFFAVFLCVDAGGHAWLIVDMIPRFVQNPWNSFHQTKLELKATENKHKHTQIRVREPKAQKLFNII